MARKNNSKTPQKRIFYENLPKSYDIKKTQVDVFIIHFYLFSDS